MDSGEIKMSIKYSVIIPTYNRIQILKRCLQHISKITNPSEEWEILVINNNLTDNIEEVVNSYRDKLHHLRYFNEPNPGLHSGRNLGCENANGEILCYLDDDSFVSKQWLKGIEKAFADPEVVLVGGLYLPEYESEAPRWVNEFWTDTEWGKCLGILSLLDFGEEVKTILPYYVYGCNFNIRKDILLKLGGFHPDAMPKELIRFRGDGESAVSRKIEELGYKTLYHPYVKIYHLVPASRMTIDYFCWRSYLQGISDSFAKIRKGQGLYREAEAEAEEKNLPIPRKVVKIIQKKLQDVKNRIFDVEPKEIREIRGKIRKSWEDGFAFHQKEVKNDPKLLEWVLRKNYLGENGKLPE